MKKSETQLRHMQTRLRRALDTRPEPRRLGLGEPESSLTRRVALVPDLSPTLVHPLGRRGLPDLVDPSITALLDSLTRASRRLSHRELSELVGRIRTEGAKRRARLLEE